MTSADSDGESPQTQRIMTTDSQRTRRPPEISGTSGTGDTAYPSQTEATLAVAAHLADTVGQSETAQAFVDSVMRRVAEEAVVGAAASAVRADNRAREHTEVSTWWKVMVSRPRFALAAVTLVCAVNMVGVLQVIRGVSTETNIAAVSSAPQTVAPQATALQTSATALAEYYGITAQSPYVPWPRFDARAMTR